MHNVLLTGYMTAEWGLPAHQVLLTGDGHWWITLDYRKSQEPVISWIDVESGQDLPIAGSFREFFKGPVLESEFTDDDA